MSKLARLAGVFQEEFEASLKCEAVGRNLKEFLESSAATPGFIICLQFLSKILSVNFCINH